MKELNMNSNSICAVVDRHKNKTLKGNIHNNLCPVYYNNTEEIFVCDFCFGDNNATGRILFNKRSHSGRRFIVSHVVLMKVIDTFIKTTCDGMN